MATTGLLLACAIGLLLFWVSNLAYFGTAMIHALTDAETDNAFNADYAPLNLRPVYQAIKRDDFCEALALAQVELKRYPDDFEARTVTAKLQFNLGDLEAAKRTIQKTLQDTTLLDAHRQLAEEMLAGVIQTQEGHAVPHPPMQTQTVPPPVIPASVQTQETLPRLRMPPEVRHDLPLAASSNSRNMKDGADSILPPQTPIEMSSVTPPNLGVKAKAGALGMSVVGLCLLAIMLLGAFVWHGQEIDAVRHFVRNSTDTTINDEAFYSFVVAVMKDKEEFKIALAALFGLLAVLLGRRAWKSLMSSGQRATATGPVLALAVAATAFVLLYPW